MKVLLDISTLGAAENPHQRGTMGIFRVIEHNARALLAAPEIEPWFYAPRNRAASKRYFAQHLAPTGHPVTPRFAEPALPGRSLAGVVTAAEHFLAAHYVDRPWRWMATGRVLWAGARSLLGGVEPAASAGLDIFHVPGGTLPRWTRRLPGVHRFMTVYDLIPLVRPEFFPDKTRRWLRATLNSLSPDDWVLCISEWTRRDLLELCPACDPARVLVTPLAAEPFFRPENDPGKIDAVRRRYGIPPDTPYFLSVSTLEPRKNFESLIRAYAAFVRDDAARPSRLVLVGGRVRTDTHPIFEALASEDEAIRQRIIFTGYVADPDLAALYSGALAFVYLSFYEGFGLPPLEAMQCGVPVIVSNASSLPEVVGDAGVLLAPADVDGVAAEMRALYLDPARRQILAERALVRAKEFSWERFAADTLAAYHLALTVGK